MPVEFPLKSFFVPFRGPEILTDPLRQPAGAAVHPLHPQIAFLLIIAAILEGCGRDGVLSPCIGGIAVYIIGLPFSNAQQEAQDEDGNQHSLYQRAYPPESGSPPPWYGKRLPLCDHPAAFCPVAEHPHHEKQIHSQPQQHKGRHGHGDIGQEQLPHAGVLPDVPPYSPDGPIDGKIGQAPHLVGQGLLPHVIPLHILVGLDRGRIASLFGPEVKQSPVLFQQLPSGLPAEGQIVRPGIPVLFPLALPPGGLHPAPAGALRTPEGGGKQPHLLQLPAPLRLLVQLRLGRLGILDGVAEPADTLLLPHVSPSSLDSTSSSHISSGSAPPFIRNNVFPR